MGGSLNGGRAKYLVDKWATIWPFPNSLAAVHISALYLAESPAEIAMRVAAYVKAHAPDDYVADFEGEMRWR
jgi:hypothetical protein